MTDDVAQQHMLFCLQALGDSHHLEAMFIISKLRFRGFLRHAPSRPPLPEGEFDIVTVSPGKGLGIGEIKSVGYNVSSLNKTEVECRADIANKLDKAIPQLKKQKTVLTTMLQSCAPDVPIRPFLMLPYVTRDQLLEAVQSADPKKKLPKKLCKILGAKGVKEATELCVCSDDVFDRSQPWPVPSDVLSKLEAWFQRRFGTSGDPVMSDDMYLDVIARLAGPATAIYVHCPSPPRLEVHTVSQLMSLPRERTAPQRRGTKAQTAPTPSPPRMEVRTVQEAVSHVGDRIAPQPRGKMAQIVLTPGQLKLLEEAPKLVWLTGPPGTGKTITVVLQGLVWLNQGHNVHVLATRFASFSACQQVFHQLQKTLDSDPAKPEPAVSDSSRLDPARSDSAGQTEPGSDAQQVTQAESSERKVGTPQFYVYDFFNEKEGEEQVNAALAQLRKLASSDPELRVILDECYYSGDVKERYERFFKELKESVPQLSVWCTSVYNNIKPDYMDEVQMTVPLRCPPVVLQEVQCGTNQRPNTYRYTEAFSGCPAPSDGLRVKWLSHSGIGHDGEWPIHCFTCGKEVAAELRKLGLGSAIAGDASTITARATGRPSVRPPKLEYRDVVVITFSAEEKNVSKPNGFVSGLISEGVPVRVLPRETEPVQGSEEKKVFEDLATAQSDVVTLVWPSWVGGLERKVVVHLTGIAKKGYDDKDLDWWAQYDRTHSFSRCTSRLIVVKCPGHPLQEGGVVR